MDAASPRIKVLSSDTVFMPVEIGPEWFYSFFRMLNVHPKYAVYHTPNPSVWLPGAFVCRSLTAGIHVNRVWQRCLCLGHCTVENLYAHMTLWWWLCSWSKLSQGLQGEKGDCKDQQKSIELGWTRSWRTHVKAQLSPRSQGPRERLWPPGEAQGLVLPEQILLGSGFGGHRRWLSASRKRWWFGSEEEEQRLYSAENKQKNLDVKRVNTAVNALPCNRCTCKV